MRKHFFYLALIFAIFILSSMKPETVDNYVRFDNDLFVSKFEITNGEYKQFINQLKENYGNDTVVSFLPDTALWTSKFNNSYNEPYTNMYYWHPSYDNYPVVNINKKAMESYSTWLTEKYNSNQKRKFKKVIFRLPTEREWMQFSSPLPGHKLPWYGDYPYVMDKECNKVCMLTNIKVMDYKLGKYNYVQDGALITCSVGSYKPNKIGIYDIIGNVAELTSDDKLKGGSWSNTLSECYVDISQDFELPDPRVGFRLVMEIIER